MKVYVACYNGTDTDKVIGVFNNIENAKNAILKDYEKTQFNYNPCTKEIEDIRIYISNNYDWYDEWYIVESEMEG